MNYQEHIRKKRKACGIAVLAVLLFTGLTYMLMHLFSVPFFFSLLQPFTALESFLVLWTNETWIFALPLILIPLSAWFPLNRDIRAGRYFLIVPQCIILAADAVVTPICLFFDAGKFNAFGGRVPLNFGTIALLGAAGAVYPAAVLILTNKWKPKI